jgi:ABC-type antimicrobial peptide transport system permease subunit
MPILRHHQRSAVTSGCMKRLQIMIEEDLDAALDRQAAAEGVSKAAIIRRIVRAELPTTVPLAADPLSRMIGVDSFEPGDIDDVVYR